MRSSASRESMERFRSLVAQCCQLGKRLGSSLIQQTQILSELTPSLDRILDNSRASLADSTA